MTYANCGNYTEHEGHRIEGWRVGSSNWVWCQGWPDPVREILERAERKRADGGKKP